MGKAVETGSAVVLHLLVAFCVSYVITGSLVAGGITAVVEALCNVVAHHYHEKIWAVLRLRMARHTSAGEGRTDIDAALPASAADLSPKLQGALVLVCRPA